MLSKNSLFVSTAIVFFTLLGVCEGRHALFHPREP